MNRVSVVIPTYNRREALEKVLPTYLTQEDLLELIVVNDGSRDDTGEFLDQLCRREPRLRVIHHERNEGITRSKNEAVSLARGDFVAIGEDDVFFSPDYVSVLVRAMEAEGRPMAAGRLLYMRPGESSGDTERRLAGNSGSLERRLAVFRQFFDLHLPGPTEVPFLHACSVFRRDVFVKLSFDQDDLSGSFWREDVDFCLRARAHGLRCLFVPEVACYHMPKLFNDSGCHKDGRLRYHVSVVKNCVVFTNRHIRTMRECGLRFGKHAYIALQIVNQFRELGKYWLGVLRSRRCRR